MADLEEINRYIEELGRRAKDSQAEAGQELNPLFDREEQGRPPRDFVPSSFLYIRSCDGDDGRRPVACPAFWVTSDLRVAPTANLGVPTHDLRAGVTYRFTAIVRNRGDLPVPSAKVEFYLANPTLGFNTLAATKLGVATARVQAYGAAEAAVDYMIPPAVSGHRCLFARVFSFSPLDLPLSDLALDPTVDRHVAQLNLNIVASASTFALDWIHRRNAADRLEIVPMTAQELRPLRFEALTALNLVDGDRWTEVQDRLELEFEPAEGPAIDAQRTDGGLELFSQDGDAVSLDRQAELTDRVLEALRALDSGRAEAGRFKELFREFRAMSAETVRSRVTLRLPDVPLEGGEAVGVNLIGRNMATDRVTGGIGMFVTGRSG